MNVGSVRQRNIRGARANAITYSGVETAKENGLVPYAYLTYVFERLPNVDLKDREAWGTVLPWSEALPDEVRHHR